MGKDRPREILIDGVAIRAHLVPCLGGATSALHDRDLFLLDAEDTEINEIHLASVAATLCRERPVR